MLERHFITGLITAILLAFGQWAAAEETPLRPFEDGEILVKYRETQAPQRALHYKSLWRLSTVRTFEKSGIRKVKLPADMTVNQAVALYRSDPDVLYVEPNYRYRLQALPDDRYIDRLWGLHNDGQSVNGSTGTPHADVDADRAWNLETGSRNIVVAVVDSGIDMHHPDLTANIWTNPDEIPENGVDDDGNGYVDDVHGWDFVADDNLPMDSHGHGTHVAGIIGAVGNNGAGTTGVCWRVSIMPLRFITAAQYGTTADAIAAIEYADANGADVINLSWGGSSYSQALKDAIDSVDAVVVCAAGNEGLNLEATPLYPASYDNANILSVAASDADDYPAWFTNYSTRLADVAAPGIDILSTVPSRQTLFSDGFAHAGYWTFGGTGNGWDVERLPDGRQVLTESPGNSNYSDNADTWAATTVPLNLSERTGARVDFQVAGVSAGDGDRLSVEASTDQTEWIRLWVGLEDDGLTRTISGSLPVWQWATADLGGFDGSAAVYLRFRFVSDAAGTADGFSIANLTVTCAGAAGAPDAYAYYQGTSMSAAYASGTAALILARKPTLTPAEVKLIMETSADRKPQLAGYVSTAGRINAYNSLESVASVMLQTQAVASDRVSLDWANPEMNASGFEIWRRAGNEGDFVTIAIAGPDQLAYTDSGLSADTTYVYRILSLNGTARIGYSNEASATTFSTTAAVVVGSGGGGGGGGGCFITAIR